MSDYAHAINQFYGQAELSAKILTALACKRDGAVLTWGVAPWGFWVRSVAA
jgi:hypothetical protein